VYNTHVQDTENELILDCYSKDHLTSILKYMSDKLPAPIKIKAASKVADLKVALFNLLKSKGAEVNRLSSAS
jgi:hypothetical protein